MSEQLTHVRAVARTEAHPDADAGHERPAIHDHRSGERLVDSARHLVYLLGALRALHHHDELVAAHAHDDIFRAHGGAYALRHNLQQFVTRLVAAGVVDVLEAV